MILPVPDVAESIVPWETKVMAYDGVERLSRARLEPTGLNADFAYDYLHNMTEGNLGLRPGSNGAAMRSWIAPMRSWTESRCPCSARCIPPSTPIVSS